MAFDLASLFPQKLSDRLNERFVGVASILEYSFVTGFILGGYSAGHFAALQFMAEHQHELPRNRAELMAFHRLKNYRILARFSSAGFKRGSQLVALSALFCLVRESLNLARSNNNLEYLPAWSDDIVSAGLAGATFGTVGMESSLHVQRILDYYSFENLGKGHRIYHLKRGLGLGVGLGCLLSGSKLLFSLFSCERAATTNLESKH